MPKLKTRKAVAKRIRMTKRGKLKRFRVGTSHLLGHKSSKRKRQLRRSAFVSAADRKVIIKLLPYGRG
ncbi:MAG: 50S ribosomal protein L35 [Candidatus Omnitrophica bacterium]|nr:50S ribosomal protein L35 [Candidatus Omnitrophota bacterium]